MSSAIFDAIGLAMLQFFRYFDEIARKTGLQEVPDRNDLVPANYKMILEDYAQEAKRQLGLA